VKLYNLVSIVDHENHDQLSAYQFPKNDPVPRSQLVAKVNI
jgi:hypothetical protein